MRQYLDLLKRIVDEGEDVQSGAVIQSENRKAVCRTLLAPQLRFDLREGFPAVTTKVLLFDWVVDEIMWFLRGDTNINTLGRKERTMLDSCEGEGPEGAYSETFVKRPIWNQWARPDGEVPHIYGESWRRWPYPYTVTSREGTLAESRETAVRFWDQVAHVLADLRAVKADPGNRARRRIILTGWNAPVVPDMGLAPCHTLAQFLPVNGFLDVVCHWRSIDTFTGMPFNIAQYALLAHIFGGLSGLTPRYLVCNIADCHIYDNQFEQIAEQLTREPFPAPTLAINPRFFATAPDLAIEQLKRVDHSWFGLQNYRAHRGRLKAEVAV
jgi:thymidylate synthase